MKVLLFAFLLPFFCGQTEFHVEKVWLFSKRQYTGNVPTGAPGKQLKGPSYLILCFLEIKKGAQTPVWETAYLGGNKFSVKEEPMNQDSIVTGTIKDSKTMAVIRPDRDCQIIHLILTGESGDVKTKNDGFTVKGKMGNQDVVLKSKEPVVELSPDLMP